MMKLSRIRAVLADPSDNTNFYGLSSTDIRVLKTLLYRRTGERYKECTSCGCLTCEGEEDNCSEQVICPNCMEDHSHCDNCDVLVLNDSMFNIGDTYLCGECYHDLPTCDHCGETTNETLTPVSTGGETEEWCSFCVDEYSHSCYECDETITESHTVYTLNFVYCRSCAHQCGRCGNHYGSEEEADDCECAPNFLMDYSTKVEEIKGYGKFRRIKIGGRLNNIVKRYFGTELEIEFDCEVGEKCSAAKAMAEEIAPVLERSITCKDISIAKGVDDRTGFEIKTRPDSVENTLEELKAACDFALNHDVGFYGHETDGRCGFHVHVSRVSLSPSQEVKLYFFMHDRSNANLIKAVMRRHSVGYATVVSLANTSRATEFRTAKAGRILNSDRVECLNFSHKTVEFRGGRSTLKLESLQVTLEFIEALLEFTAPATVSRKDLTADGFAAWLKNQHGFKVLKKKLS